MHEAYDHELINLATQIAKERKIRLVYGVYIGVTGPTFETPAEYRMYRTLGGDTVGMSTVPEVIVAHHCGIKTLFVSNAAGGMNPAFKIGDLMVITDHINFFPEHPLRGKNFPTGPRFPDMHEAYDHELINLATQIAKERKIRLVYGVYIGVTGPTFETPAEYRMYRTLGGDTVGMSTVPEVIVAHHCGIKTFGISVVTDLGGFDNPVEVSHEEVQEAADKAQPIMTEIMREMIKRTA
jgi:purine-nucleoside phosphorylase